MELPQNSPKHHFHMEVSLDMGPPCIPRYPVSGKCCISQARVSRDMSCYMPTHTSDWLWVQTFRLQGMFPHVLIDLYYYLGYGYFVGPGYALVICNHDPPAPGNSGNFDFWSSKSLLSPTLRGLLIGTSQPRSFPWLSPALPRRGGGGGGGGRLQMTSASYSYNGFIGYFTRPNPFTSCSLFCFVTLEILFLQD